MAYNERLAARIRMLLKRRRGVAELKMFGGLCFTVRGNMCCGALNDDLVVRVGPARYAQAVKEPHARPMDFTGRPLKGFVFVGPAGTTSSAGLATWVRRGLAFAESLPGK